PPPCFQTAPASGPPPLPRQKSPPSLPLRARPAAAALARLLTSSHLPSKKLLQHKPPHTHPHHVRARPSARCPTIATTHLTHTPVRRARGLRRPFAGSILLRKPQDKVSPKAISQAADPTSLRTAPKPAETPAAYHTIAGPSRHTASPHQ